VTVGLTYDLREDYLRAGWSAEESAEFDTIETVEAIESALHSFGFATDRIGHIRELTRRLACGDRWDIVFNFAEGAGGFGREAQVPALLDAFGVPYTFSDPLVLALTLHKGMTKHVIRDHGLPTPDFAVVADDAELARVRLPLPLFAKPVASGSSIGVSAASIIRERSQLSTVCHRLWQQLGQPVLLETFLPGREFTVGITGTGADARVVGVMEIQLHAAIDAEAYSYMNKLTWEDHVVFAPASGAVGAEAADLALHAWRVLGCRDAGRIDLRADAGGRLHFLEVNPLAGLNPVYSDLCINCRLHDVTYRQLIQAIMESALQRIPRAHRMTA
jgi:D-alanine-D-alanine ligase